MPSKSQTKELQELREEIQSLKEEIAGLKLQLTDVLGSSMDEEQIDISKFIEMVSGGQTEDSFYCEATGRYEFLDSFVTPRQDWWPKWI